MLCRYRPRAARSVSTERALAPAGDRAGFTLVEVLVAMVILAVGLLGLEALGIAAARANVQAQHRSLLSARATQVLEDRVRQVRTTQGPIVAQPEQCQNDGAVQIRVCAAVETAGLPQGAARITVTVSRTVGQPLPYTLSSYVYR